MGNCISCPDSGASNEQTELRTVEGRKKRPEVHSQIGISVAASGTPFKSETMESQSNGCRTPGSSSNRIINNVDSGANGPSSQKAEKKTFYSRIPPLGRSGSTDKKSSANSIINNASIKDNNNSYSESKIAAVFDSYKDSHEDAILAEGIEKFCRDLDVKPEDFKVLVLAWKFGAEQMCRFTRDEFYHGMKELNTDSIQGVQARLPDLVIDVISDNQKFKDLYRFAFKFALDVEIGQRILPTEMASSLWKLVFSKNTPPILPKWLAFLDAHPHIRGIPRDTWNMFLNFVEIIGDDLSSYDDTEAWPSLFDDFVEFQNDQLNQNTISTNFTSTFNGDKQDQQHHQEMMIEAPFQYTSNQDSVYSNRSHRMNSEPL